MALSAHTPGKPEEDGLCTPLGAWKKFMVPGFHSPGCCGHLRSEVMGGRYFPSSLNVPFSFLFVTELGSDIDLASVSSLPRWLQQPFSAWRSLAVWSSILGHLSLLSQELHQGARSESGAVARTQTSAPVWGCWCKRAASSFTDPQHGLLANGWAYLGSLDSMWSLIRTLLSDL